MDPFLTPSALRAAWFSYQKDHPGTRARYAAQALGVSEAAILALECGRTATRLHLNGEALLQGLDSLGIVMALTRNDAFVHEKTGRYGALQHSPNATDSYQARFRGDNITLDLDLEHWVEVFAVERRTSEGTKRSIQCFDLCGTAVHKVHLRDRGRARSFKAFVAQHRHDDQAPDLLPLPEACTEPVESLFADGASLDVPAPATLHALLKAASTTGHPIKVVVSNPGCMQSHQGPIRRLRGGRGWFNILDPGFNLHVREAALGEVYLVEEPSAVVFTTLDGIEAARFSNGAPHKPAGWRRCLQAIPNAATLRL